MLSCRLFLAFLSSTVLHSVATSNILPNMESLRVRCPCVKAFGPPIGNYTTSDLDQCTVVCFMDKECVGFSFCEMDRTCRPYSGDTLGYGTDAMLDGNCYANPVESNHDWYLLAMDEGATTTDCTDVKDSGETADDYYDVRIRGRKIRVFCLMSDGNAAKTYIDISAFTRWGGEYTDQVFRFRNFTRARLQYSKCLIRMYRAEGYFSTGDPTREDDVITGGGTCQNNVDWPGMHEVNLTGTKLRFSAGLDFAYHSWNFAVREKILDAQYHFMTGTGSCGYSYAFNADNPETTYKLEDYLPLQLHLFN